MAVLRAPAVPLASVNDVGRRSAPWLTRAITVPFASVRETSAYASAFLNVA
jgi:hypothetical protein